MRLAPPATPTQPSQRTNRIQTALRRSTLSQLTRGLHAACLPKRIPPSQRSLTDGGNRGMWRATVAPPQLGDKCAPVGAEYALPLSDVTARRRRPYLFGRDWTSTDIGACA